MGTHGMRTQRLIGPWEHWHFEAIELSLFTGLMHNALVSCSVVRIEKLLFAFRRSSMQIFSYVIMPSIAMNRSLAILIESMLLFVIVRAWASL